MEFDSYSIFNHKRVMATISATKLKKVTVHIPEDLLKAAQERSGKGITQTINEALQSLASRLAYKKLEELEGSCRLDLNIDELREDRDM